jgi:hypothetical protein
MAPVLAFDVAKTVVDIAVIKMAIDHLLDIGSPESLLP